MSQITCFLIVYPKHKICPYSMSQKFSIRILIYIVYLRETEIVLKMHLSSGSWDRSPTVDGYYPPLHCFQRF